MKLPESIETIRSAGSSSSSEPAQRARIDAAARARGRRARRRSSGRSAIRARDVLGAVARPPRGRPARAGRPPRCTARRRRRRGRSAGARRGRSARGRPGRAVACGLSSFAVARGPHVQRAAPADDEVGAHDELGGQRRGEAARDAERPRVAVEQPVRDGRRRQQRPARASQLPQRFPAAAGAAAGDEHRPFGGVEQVRQVGRPPPTSGRTGAGPAIGGSGSAGVGRGLDLDVQRQVQHHGPALLQRGPEGPHGVGHRARRPSARAPAPRRPRWPARPGRCGSSTAPTRPRSRRRARSAASGSWPPR